MRDTRRSAVTVTVRFLLAAALLLLTTCTVSFSPDLKYSCTGDDDCGGGGWKCTTIGTPVCCLPTGAEICDGKDNDCDGVVDNTKKSEVCNGVDDDCDGEVDEGFNVMTDAANCGACGHACASTDVCLDGVCTLRTEVECSDGIDNDGNGKVDCLDASCEASSCGAGCVCKGLAKTESRCDDTLDNDGDTQVDCDDADCLDLSCGAGCVCGAAGTKKETGCYDLVDNDGDAKVDCADPDCVGQPCAAPPVFFTCSPGGTCNCHGGAQIAETGVLCRDGIDNDCNGKKDCAETTCDGKSCSPDGGADCTCAQARNKEVNCSNQLDDDGDGQVDCADPDCPQGTGCLTTGGAAGTCSATRTCE